MRTMRVPFKRMDVSSVKTVSSFGSLACSLVYIGMGPSWECVRDLNMAGHYYTVQ